jgi:lipopolysaccharide/colanic/teichoic acid biosynthesis glycosyltransferase
MRRALDVALSLGALLTLAPILGAVALMILIEEGRPVFYRQERIGKNGIPFQILKFRSMRVAAAGRSITVAGDARITAVGACLRKYKLDELPQLLNVLRGEMSLIGPRPEVADYVEPGNDVWRAVLQMRPGITDLATLAFRGEEELLRPAADPEAFYRTCLLPEKLRLNLRYQQKRTFLLDLKLLWLTARYSLFPRGFDRERITQSFGI